MCSSDLSLIFQIKTGYLYFQLGSIIACFMLGLACGSYFAVRYMKDIENFNIAFNYSFLILALYPLFIIILFNFFLKNAGDINILVFLSILFIPSFIIGGLFPLANRISLDKNDDGRSFGRLYAYDLFGSALGALLTTAIFIPLLGIYPTLVTIACVNLVALSLVVYDARC